ncbi:MAG: ABC transporter ATP-binding protein [Thermoplasmata archaeon]
MVAIIEARGVHKTYDTGRVKVEALRGVDFTVEKGEMVAVMGPSGCGKTTMLNCLSGLDDLTSGKVLIEGKDIHAMNDDERTAYRAKKMGFIFQSFNLLPVLTALENVELPLLLVGTPMKEARARALEALALVGLIGRENHKPAELSGGEQQRVAIARSLVNDPALVWADEPTGNLDTENSREVMELMRKLNREKGLTFVIVTHDPAVGGMCGRLIRMENGRIIGQETGAR